MADATGAVRAKPLSPHLSIWRWHLTMAGSILHRATGVALYVGALIVAWGAVSLAMGPAAYGQFLTCMGSIPGELILFGLTLSLFYHLANGIRHLVWDAGYGFTPRSATMSLVVVLAFTLAASLAIWALAFATGGVR
jgi:succinate dehydrogenase / fumarate reductase cytochrome b subunit